MNQKGDLLPDVVVCYSYANIPATMKAPEPMSEFTYSAAACTPDAIRSRIVLLAGERSIPEHEIERVLCADFSAPDEVVMKFVEDHDVSMNWLFCGDLRGLRMMRRPSSTWDYGYR